MNQIVLSGRLVHSPELKTTPNGKSVCTFSIAVDRQFKNADGDKEADFINIQLWDKSAEFVKNYVSKGDKVGIVGRLQIRSYNDKDGNKRTIAEVIGTSVESFESKKRDTTAPIQATRTTNMDDQQSMNVDASSIEDPFQDC